MLVQNLFKRRGIKVARKYQSDITFPSMKGLKNGLGTSRSALLCDGHCLIIARASVMTRQGPKNIETAVASRPNQQKNHEIRLHHGKPYFFRPRLSPLLFRHSALLCSGIATSGISGTSAACDGGRLST